MSYPDYSREERIADNVVHVVGVTIACIGILVLFAYGAQGLSQSAFIAIVIYALAMILMLGASAAYHMAAHTSARPVLRRIDHAAIYIKIAATLTPLAVLLGTLTGYLVLSLIWLLAMAGAFSKLMARPGRMSTGWIPQVALGWLGLALLIPLWPQLPGNSLTLILAGGLIYTGAIVCYCWEGLKYCNAIWHVCVLVATACYFLGISAALPTQAKAVHAVYLLGP